MASELPDLSQYLDADTGPYLGWDPVNAPMIRHWCEALGDTCPIYSDPAAARAEGFAGVVAPPAMLQAWTMFGYGGRLPPGSDERDPMAVLPVLEAAGYPGVVAVNCEQDYPRYLTEGEKIRHLSSIESISAEKTTALGRGFFVTQLCTYLNEVDEVVGSMRFRVFKYRPRTSPEAGSGSAGAGAAASTPGADTSTASGAATPAPDSDSPSPGAAVAPRSGPVKVGDRLAELDIPITPKLIVAAAIASRDYQDVHHDKAAAQALGSPDIFMNILTTNGLVGRYASDWAGVGSRIQRIAIRLGAPNFPGDRMTLSGQLESIDESKGTATLVVRGANRLGDHVTGQVVVAL